MKYGLDQVAEFASELVATDDIDPLYPVLRKLYEDWHPDSALSFTTYYLMFYNVASAWQFCNNEYIDFPLNTPPYPVAVERRNLRPIGQFQRHLDSLETVESEFGLRAWITSGWGEDPEANYEIFFERAQKVYGNGRWAAFKWCELLKKVHDFPLAAPDIRAKYCSGPIEGLETIYGYHTNNYEFHNIMGDQLQADLAKRGIHLDIEGVETVACNFASLAKGRYYIGHDWDELMGHINSSGMPSLDQTMWIRTLRDVMPQRYFQYGSIGVDKERCKAFRDTGKILLR